MANLSIRNLAAAIRARIDPSYRIDLYIPERGPINLKNCLLNAPRGEGIGLMLMDENLPKRIRKSKVTKETGGF